MRGKVRKKREEREEKKEKRKEEVFIRQQYGKVGRQAAVKVCSWTKRALRGEGCCYKHYFYGISTGRCLEMTPVLACNQRCKHCWRDQSLLVDKIKGKVEEPGKIIEGCIAERKRLLMGFKGNKKIELRKFEECLIPKQAAISLSGEPCLYPKLNKLVEEFYKNGFDSVFLVTNGTVPLMLKKLSELKKGPTNIYLSVEGWDKESYRDFCKPLKERQWEKILESMDILRELSVEGKIKTVLRITCVKGFNMDKVKEFKWIVERMRPDYVECKGYMFVGYSRKRMKEENMPKHFEVKKFGDSLAKLTGYKIKGEQEESLVVLLGKN